MRKTKAKSKKGGARRAADAPRSPLALWVEHLAKAFFIAVGVGLMGLTVGATALCFAPNPTDWIPYLGIFISAITAAVCGFAAAKFHRHSALLCGLYRGSLCMLGMLLASLFLGSYASGYATWASLLLRVGFLLCAVGGAYLGNRPKKLKKR